MRVTSINKVKLKLRSFSSVILNYFPVIKIKYLIFYQASYKLSN
jgi:hypothetical protein